MQNYDVPVPLILATVFLVVMVRWVFKPSRRRTGVPESGPGADLGLLIPVVNHSGRAAALAAKNRLSEQGIRCSVSRIEADCYDVLVFAPDAERAAALLAP